MKHILDIADKTCAGCSAPLAQIRAVRNDVENLHFDEFFEPKSAFDLSGKTPKLIGISLPDVAAWKMHVAYGMRARLLSLEPTIVEAAAARRTATAVILLRSYAETAGLAALALMTLRDGQLEPLRSVMQRTLFGSALANSWKRSPEFAAVLPFSESQPLVAKDLMTALDRFVAAGGPDRNDRYQKAYRILSEYAHPNSRSVREFLRFKEEEPIGWRVWYSTEEEQGTQGQIMVLSLLAEMMRLGYSASELLRLGDVVEVYDGFTIRPPAPGEMQRILKKIMLLEDEQSIH